MINMGVIPLLLGFVIVGSQTTTSQNTSSEDINQILDRLLQQVNDSNTKWNGEDSVISEPEQDVPSDAGDKAGTAQSRSGTDYGETEPTEDKSAENDKNLKLLEELFQQDIKRKVSTERSPYGHNPPKPLSILHDYPEIIIDHIVHNNGEYDPTSKYTNKPTEFLDQPKSSSNEQPQSSIYRNIEQTSSPENTNSKINPRLKNLFDSILKNSEVHDSFAEHQWNKQNVLLEKILEQISVNKVQDSPKVNPLANDVSALRLMPTYSQNLQHDVLSATYMHTPVLAYNLAPQVPISPYLGRGLLGLSRPAALQRASLSSNLFQRNRPTYSYGRNLGAFRG